MELLGVRFVAFRSSQIPDRGLKRKGAERTLPEIFIGYLENKAAWARNIVSQHQEGDEGNLSRFTRLMRAITNMKALKQQSEGLLRTVETLLNDSAEFQENLRVYLDNQAQTLNDIDKEGPYKDGKTFQQKLDEASAMLKE